MTVTTIPWKENWGISYEVIFGTRGRKEYLVPTSIASPNYASAEDDQLTIPVNALRKHNLNDPRGFRMDFESSQMATSKGSDTEHSYLVMDNLNDEELRVLNQPNCVVMIKAGFQGKTVLCYTGDVVDIDVNNNPPDIEYRIKLSAAGNAVKDTMVNTHYEEDMSAKDVIIDMAGRFSGLAIGSYGLETESKYYRTGGNSYTGDLVTNFDREMMKHNLQYAVVNGKVAIIPYRWKEADYQKFAKTNFNLPEGGIKSITEVKDNKGKSATDKKSTDKTIQVNTTFLPIEIGQFITIPNAPYTKRFRGTYVVEGRRIILSSLGVAWDIVLHCKEVNV